MAKPILLYNVIHSAAAKDFTETILATPEDEPIDIWINSPGGSLSAGWSMLAALQSRDKVNMTVMGDASSMAFFMLLFASNVIAYDTANLIVHRAAGSDESELSAEELKEIDARNKVIRNKMEARIDEAKFIKVTGKTFDDIFSMDDRLDVSLSANDAKDIGLVDEVVNLDTKKRAEIESLYYNQIAALATPKKEDVNLNINSNKNDMGIFTKDPLLLGAIGETQFAYSKLEVKAKIKILGEGDQAPISGTFEAKDKKVTVINDEITAIDDIDTKKEQIEALKLELKEVKALIVAKVEPEKIEPEISQDEVTALRLELKEIKETLATAKITASKPALPVGEFQNQVVEDVEMTRREKFSKIQKEAYEAKQKEREGL